MRSVTGYLRTQALKAAKSMRLRESISGLDLFTFAGREGRMMTATLSCVRRTTGLWRLSIVIPKASKQDERHRMVGVGLGPT